MEEKKEKVFRALFEDAQRSLKKVAEMLEDDSRGALGVLLPHYLRSLTEEEFGPLNLTSPVSILMEFGKFKVGDMLVKMFKERYPISTELTLELANKADFTKEDEDLLSKMVRKAVRTRLMGTCDVNNSLLQTTLHFHCRPSNWNAT